MGDRIRVGIIGANPDRSFAAQAHLPALRALPEYEIMALCTTRQETANAAAQKYSVPYAFTDPYQLINHPMVDLVTVSVKVPDHYSLVMAAIEAGKHIYCEWPLGRNTDEAVRMRQAADARGVRHVVGLQGRVSPAIAYTRDLIAENYVGHVLAATLIGCAPSWGHTLEWAYQADRHNGANLLTIAGGHMTDALCYCIGEFQKVSAFVVSQRDHISLAETGRIIPKTSPDQLVVSGLIGNGIAVSLQVRGGMKRGVAFLLEIHGDAGDLVLKATSRASMQRQNLILEGAQGDCALQMMPIPDRYRWVPDDVPEGSATNVAQLYRRLAVAIRNDSAVTPDFNAAVERHRLLDRIVHASETGQAA